MFTSLQEEEGNLAVWHKFWRFWTSWQSSKIFSELKMIFNKFLLGLPPTKVNIDSELFSLGLTREMLTREIIKFCIHYILARLYFNKIQFTWVTGQNRSSIICCVKAKFRNWSCFTRSKMVRTSAADELCHFCQESLEFYCNVNR